MFYKFLKILVGFTLRIFFKKIFITGTENIHKDRAQLIASNHPNGFLEPLLMACFFSKDLHFLVRGDVFDNPLLKPILKSTHQIPIFRFRDGFSKLRENSQTMDESIQVLLDKKNLLIFAEGGTESIKKLRPLQKGIVRIAFQALEKNPNLDLEILPVGINFTYPSKFNKEVMMRVNTPIKVLPYFDLYQKDKNKGVDALLSDVYEKVKENIIHLENQQLINTFENLVIVERSKKRLPYIPVHVKDTSILDNEKLLAYKIDNLNEETLSSVKSDIKSVNKKLKKAGLVWEDFNKCPIDLLRSLLLFFGFLPAIIGIVLHLIPIATGYFFTKKIVKQREFKASILMVVTLVIMLIQYIIIIVLVATFSISYYFLILFITSGVWARYYYAIFKETLFIQKSKFNVLRNLALEILNKVQKG